VTQDKGHFTDLLECCIEPGRRRRKKENYLKKIFLVVGGAKFFYIFFRENQHSLKPLFHKSVTT
jgi:hypothetical protein